ncbi:MAG: PucR family transcriptional regulator ligand-binding domain-containing protein [Trueperaceae bacterium]
MRFRDVLAVPCLANARVIAGDAHLDRDVRWVHVLDNPDAVTWARPGQFVLTTGYAWPREAPRLHKLFRQLAEAGVAGVGLAVTQFPETVLVAGAEEPADATVPMRSRGPSERFT